MRIAFISGLYPPHTKGGGEISTYLIAEALKARGHEVAVVTAQEVPELIAKPLFERRMSRKIAKKLGRVLLEADVYHAHDFRSALALSELQIPYSSPLSRGENVTSSSLDKGRRGGISVVTIRDYAPVCGTTNNILADGSRCRCTLGDVFKTQRFREAGFPRNFARAWQYWYNMPYRKKAFLKLRHQIFISHAQKEEISEQLNLTGVHAKVIYNPVGAEYFQPLLHSAKGLVLCAGRVEDYKGLGLLLQAWEQAVKEFPRARLRIVGEGAQMEYYNRRVAGQGLQERVVFSGRVPHEQLRDEYDMAEIVVSPHIWTEPFGRTVAEAMARGKIVVAANSGGPGEIIQDGETGLLFERNSVSELSDRLKFALGMRDVEKTEMGKRARAWAQENLAADNIASQYEDFYREISAKT